MSFLERLYLLMEDRDIKKNALCKTLKISGNSFVNWENRGTLPSAEIIIKLANYFNVTADYLLGIEKSDDKYVSIPKDSLIALIESMTPESRQKLENFVKNDFRFDLKE